MPHAFGHPDVVHHRGRGREIRGTMMQAISSTTVQPMPGSTNRPTPMMIRIVSGNAISSSRTAALAS
ncbi:MAG TPA: hypothetical protein VFG15_11680 [Amycolatopsis sp.]|nr:hypothetical protein [Amycolatopsis sp.]